MRAAKPDLIHKLYQPLRVVAHGPGRIGALACAETREVGCGDFEKLF